MSGYTKWQHRAHALQATVYHMTPDPFTIVLLAAASISQLGRDTAHAIRSLPVREAQTARRVHLSGVVTFCPPPHGYFYLQDDTAGIRVEWPHANRQLNVGARVEVRGTTVAGAFLPEVRADVVQVDEQNRGEYPRAVPFNLTLDDSAYLDGQWVEVEAVVQRAWTTDGWLQLDLARGRGNAVAAIPLPLPVVAMDAEKLRGAVVRVRGVCRATPNANRQVVGPARLFVSDIREFDRVKGKSLPADLFTLPPTSARDLALFRPDPIDARLPVRVTGVVTLDQTGKQLFLQDGTGIVQVTYTNGASVSAGQRVTAVGFPRLGTDPARLDNAHTRVTDATIGNLPEPHPASVADAAAGKLEGRVVTFTGTVLDAGSQGGLPTATMVVDGVSFVVIFLDLTATVEPGSRIKVIGVATRQQFDKFRPHTFAAIVDRDGLCVLEGPPVLVPVSPVSWWTGRRVVYLTAGFLGVFLAGGAGATVLRLQVRRATALVRKQSEEREKLERQLKLAARLEATGRLTGNVAHDFNNLLTVINGCAFQLEKEIGGDNDPVRTANFATAIRRAGDQAATLTRQLLMFNRQRTTIPYPLDLNETLGHAIDLLERLVGDHIAIRLVEAPGLPLVLAEPGQLSQVLLNLAVNAADAMPAGGDFTLATSTPEHGWVRLTATDTGTGMTEETKSQVFNRGFTTKAADKGTGLGLSTVYEIVQEFGGRIRFASELGRGTAFEIDLQAAGAPAMRPLSPSPTEITINVTNATQSTVCEVAPGAIVLLVEDEVAVCTLLRHVLVAAGFTVIAAGEPDEALRLLGDHLGALDLLITDVVLPGLGGGQLAERVRMLHPGAKVLFMSGYTADEIIQQGVCEDQVNLLHKPFLPHELIERVTKLLADVRQ